LRSGACWAGPLDGADIVDSIEWGAGRVDGVGAIGVPLTHQIRGGVIAAGREAYTQLVLSVAPVAVEESPAPGIVAKRIGLAAVGAGEVDFAYRAGVYFHSWHGDCIMVL
jgi:hypothetical protein